MPEQAINVEASLLVCMPRIEKSLGGAIYQAVKVPITVGSSHKPAVRTVISLPASPIVIYHYRVKLQADIDNFISLVLFGWVKEILSLQMFSPRPWEGYPLLYCIDTTCAKM